MLYGLVDGNQCGDWTGDNSGSSIHSWRGSKVEKREAEHKKRLSSTWCNTCRVSSQNIRLFYCCQLQRLFRRCESHHWWVFSILILSTFQCHWGFELAIIAARKCARSLSTLSSQIHLLSSAYHHMSLSSTWSSPCLISSASYRTPRIVCRIFLFFFG